jgi:hypothetical protein
MRVFLENVISFINSVFIALYKMFFKKQLMYHLNTTLCPMAGIEQPCHSSSPFKRTEL